MNRYCPECEDVHTREAACFVCGAETVPATTPLLNSQHAYASPMTDQQWAQVRREIGV